MFALPAWVSMDVLAYESFARLLDEHGARLTLYARLWCETPDDVVQEAFVRLLATQPAPTNLTGWLYRVVRNAALTAARSEQRRTKHEAVAAGLRAAWFDSAPGDALDATAAVETLQSLPLEQREALVLRLWSDLSFAQIGELTETTSSTAHRRYAEGLAELRRQMHVPLIEKESPR